MADQWHYQLFGQEFGPVEFDDVTQMLTTGELGADDMVRRGSTGDWAMAQAVTELQRFVAAVPFETADVATDIDSFMLVDEQDSRQHPQVATDIDSFMMIDEADTKPVKPAAQPVKAAKPAKPARPVAPAAPENKNAAVWYYQSSGRDKGPIPLAELVALIDLSEIEAADLVRKGAKGRWMQAESIAELMPHFVVATPAEPEPEPEPVVASPPVAIAASAPQPTPPPMPAPSTSSGAVAPPWVTGAAPALELNWFCFMNDQEYGPVSLADLTTWVEQGQVTREMYLKHGLSGEWILATQVPNLFPPEPEPEPEPEPTLHPAAAAVIANASNLVDAEKSELVQQLLTLLKQGLSAELMGGAQIAAPTAGLGWYCNISGSVIGPVAIESLVQMVLQKRLFPEDLIRMGPTGEWFPAKSVPDLFPASGPSAKSKKSSFDSTESVMERIDRMYREGQEAQAKADAAKAANPNKAPAKVEPANRPSSAADVIRQMNVNMAKGAPPASKSASSSMSDIKLDGKTFGVLAALALIGLGIWYAPTFMGSMAAKSAYGKLIAIKFQVVEAQESGAAAGTWDKRAKDWKKTIDEITKPLKGGATGSPKRDVSTLGRNLRDLIDAAGKPLPPGSPADAQTDFQRAQKMFDDKAKSVGKKLKLIAADKAAKPSAKDSKKKKK